MITATATEMQNNFGKYLNILMNGQEIIVTKNGKEVGRFMPKESVVSYLTDSLKGILKNDYDYIYFIIGADSLFALDTWYKPEYVCSHCHLLAINRDSHSADELNRQKTYLHDKFGAEIDFVDCSNLPYSSTEIRDRLEQGLDISNYVPADVKSYIYDNQLYNSKAFKE